VARPTLRLKTVGYSTFRLLSRI